MSLLLVLVDVALFVRDFSLVFGFPSYCVLAPSHVPFVPCVSKGCSVNHPDPVSVLRALALLTSIKDLGRYHYFSPPQRAELASRLEEMS